MFSARLRRSKSPRDFLLVLLSLVTGVTLKLSVQEIEACLSKRFYMTVDNLELQCWFMHGDNTMQWTSPSKWYCTKHVRKSQKDWKVLLSNCYNHMRNNIYMLSLDSISAFSNSWERVRWDANQKTKMKFRPSQDMNSSLFILCHAYLSTNCIWQGTLVTKKFRRGWKPSFSQAAMLALYSCMTLWIICIWGLSCHLDFLWVLDTVWSDWMIEAYDPKKKSIANSASSLRGHCGSACLSTYLEALISGGKLVEICDNRLIFSISWSGNCSSFACHACWQLRPTLEQESQYWPDRWNSLNEHASFHPFQFKRSAEVSKYTKNRGAGSSESVSDLLSPSKELQLSN